MTGEDRSTGELGRSIDALTEAVKALREDFQRGFDSLDEKYPRKEVVDLQIHDIRDDIKGLKDREKDRDDSAANTRRMVYLALLSAFILTPLSALLLTVIRGH